MIKVRKKEGKIIEAYRLEEDLHPELIRLMEAGKIIKTVPGKYEVFSQEATGKSGEQACDGDFIKIDSTGSPYPNKQDFFLENHRQVGENSYEQIPKVLYAWRGEEPMCEELEFLVDKKGLVLDEQSEEGYFQAPLWGTVLSAARDAVIVFYEITRNKDGKITDADFNFVEKTEFDRTYDILTE